MMRRDLCPTRVDKHGNARVGSFVSVKGREQSLYGPGLRLQAQVTKMNPFGGKDTLDSGIMYDLPITGHEVDLSTRHNICLSKAQPLLARRRIRWPGPPTS